LQTKAIIFLLYDKRESLESEKKEDSLNLISEFLGQLYLLFSPANQPNHYEEIAEKWLVCEQELQIINPSRQITPLPKTREELERVRQKPADDGLTTATPARPVNPSLRNNAPRQEVKRKIQMKDSSTVVAPKIDDTNQKKTTVHSSSTVAAPKTDDTNQKKTTVPDSSIVAPERKVNLRKPSEPKEPKKVSTNPAGGFNPVRIFAVFALLAIVATVSVVFYRRHIVQIN
jgi:hypothetical protein